MFATLLFLLLYRYSSFVPLHKLWQQYMEELLKKSQDQEARILGADFHGCKLTVTEAANPRHVAIEGIVMKDSAATFTIITQNDHIHHIAKHKSNFCFNIGERMKVVLMGTNLQQERSKG